LSASAKDLRARAIWTKATKLPSGSCSIHWERAIRSGTTAGRSARVGFS
jgi:hypothetical protein